MGHTGAASPQSVFRMSDTEPSRLAQSTTPGVGGGPTFSRRRDCSRPFRRPEHAGADGGSGAARRGEPESAERDFRAPLRCPGANALSTRLQPEPHPSASDPRATPLWTLFMLARLLLLDQVISRSTARPAKGTRMDISERTRVSGPASGDLPGSNRRLGGMRQADRCRRGWPSPAGCRAAPFEQPSPLLGPRRWRHQHLALRVAPTGGACGQPSGRDRSGRSAPRAPRPDRAFAEPGSHSSLHRARPLPPWPGRRLGIGVNTSPSLSMSGQRARSDGAGRPGPPGGQGSSPSGMPSRSSSASGQPVRSGSGCGLLDGPTLVFVIGDAVTVGVGDRNPERPCRCVGQRQLPDADPVCPSR